MTFAAVATDVLSNVNSVLELAGVGWFVVLCFVDISRFVIWNSLVDSYSRDGFFFQPSWAISAGCWVFAITVEALSISLARLFHAVRTVVILPTVSAKLCLELAVLACVAKFKTTVTLHWVGVESSGRNTDKAEKNRVRDHSSLYCEY